jgi:peroxiredoxin
MTRLTKGNKMPDFTVNTANRKNIRISEIADGKPSMMIVLRYIGCPLCRLDVHMLNERYDEFINKGVTVFFVMQSKPESIRRDLKDSPVPFEIVCDDKLEIYKTLCIDPAKTKEELLGDGAAKLAERKEKIEKLGIVHGENEGIEEQLPAFFYLDKDLNVKYSHYAENIVDMPTIDDMLAMI